jgi:tetratricopeptide (TPR) repeat protein
MACFIIFMIPNILGAVDHAARIDSLQAVYAVNPDNNSTVASLADEYLQIGDINAAELLLFQFTEDNKADSRILYLFGKLNDLKENLPKAVEYYHKAIMDDSSYWRPYLNLAYLFDITLQYDSMNSYLSMALIRSPFPESLYYDFGYSFDMMGHPDSALAYYRLALESDSLDYQAALNIGAIWGIFGKYDSARYYTELSLTANPNISESRYNYAEILSYYSEFEKAISQYQTALALDPSNYGIHKRLGDLFDILGDSLTAEIHFEEFLRLAPPFFRSEIEEVKARLSPDSR